MNKKTIHEYCTGCGLCHSLQGSLIDLDEKGFPRVKEESICDLSFFKSICPSSSYREKANHGIWGIVDYSFVGYSYNSSVRFKASSGGALTALSLYLLEKKIVDGIIHTTFDPNDPTKTITVISRTKDDVINRCGSRYSISSPLTDILQICSSNEKYAFIGKPCDVMALKKAMGENGVLSSSIAILLSFFCAGEPSQGAQLKLLDAMGCKKDECEQITYRGNGWPGFTTVQKKDGSLCKLEYKEAWGKHLGRDIRKSCRFCLDGTGDYADIVCADYWYLDSCGLPDFSEHAGRNIIISRNPTSSVLLRNALAEKYIIKENDDSELLSRLKEIQPGQFKRKCTMHSMLWAMRLFNKTIPDYGSSYLRRYARNIGMITRIKFFLGTIKRIVKNKI